jgi:hypothetical protein
MTVNLELLVADLAHKLRYRQLLPESPNLEADLRGIIASNQRPETATETTCPVCGNWMPGHATGAGDICTCPKVTTIIKQPLTSPAASGNMGALQA